MNRIQLNLKRRNAVMMTQCDLFFVRLIVARLTVARLIVARLIPGPLMSSIFNWGPPQKVYRRLNDAVGLVGGCQSCMPGNFSHPEFFAEHFLSGQNLLSGSFWDDLNDKQSNL